MIGLQGVYIRTINRDALFRERRPTGMGGMAWNMIISSLASTTPLRFALFHWTAPNLDWIITSVVCVLTTRCTCPARHEVLIITLPSCERLMSQQHAKPRSLAAHATGTWIRTNVYPCHNHCFIFEEERRYMMIISPPSLSRKNHQSRRGPITNRPPSGRPRSPRR